VSVSKSFKFVRVTHKHCSKNPINHRSIWYFYKYLYWYFIHKMWFNDCI